MKRAVIGIDEVGRGALAGPVIVAAARIPVGFRPPKILGPLKDSKQLSKIQRERWFAYFKTHPDIEFAVARIYPRMIEKMNISRAANQAAYHAHTKLLRGERKKSARSKWAGIPTFLDGGLYLGNGMRRIHDAHTVIKGDETIPAIAVASIIAKVTRDRYMCLLAKRYPHFGFEVHKGYATKHHRDAIAKSGICDAHRLTFLGQAAIMNQ